MHCSLLFCFSSCCYSSTKTITITILEIDLISTGVTETLSKTTAWRHRKKKFEEEQRAAAKAEGLPTSKKVRMAYTCRKCKQPMSKENGHSQYFGQTYCPKFRERNGSPKRPRSGRRRKLPPVKQEYNSLHEM